MKRADIKNFINVDDFFAFAERAVEETQCSYIEAFADYGRKHDIELDIIASLIRSHKGKMKAKMIEQCKELRLID